MGETVHELQKRLKEWKKELDDLQERKPAPIEKLLHVPGSLKMKIELEYWPERMVDGYEYIMITDMDQGKVRIPLASVSALVNKLKEMMGGWKGDTNGS